MMLGLDEFQEQVTEYVCTIEVTVIGSLHLCQIIVETHELFDLSTNSVERLFVQLVDTVCHSLERVRQLTQSCRVILLHSLYNIFHTLLVLVSPQVQLTDIIA